MTDARRDSTGFHPALLFSPTEEPLLIRFEEQIAVNLQKEYEETNATLIIPCPNARLQHSEGWQAEAKLFSLVLISQRLEH